MVNIELNHGWAVRVSGFPVTHSAGFRIDLQAGSNRLLRRRSDSFSLRLEQG
jgi:hypothetical protein